MEIIPIHNKKSQEVKSFKEIREEAEKLRKFTNEGPFKGPNYESCYALHHAQVSEDPYNFFTVNEKIFEGKIPKTLGHWLIINPKITQWAEPVSWEEACMSFPFKKPKRTNRMDTITVEYRTPWLFGILIKRVRKLEGDMAFLLQHEVEHSVGVNIYDKKD